MWQNGTRRAGAARPLSHCAWHERPQGSSVGMASKHRLTIEYCTGCRWMLRAAWMAQELLTTFEGNLSEVALVPGTGGVFEIRLDDRVLWSRTAEGRFPELREAKQRVRDVVDPGRALGHSDSPVGRSAGEE